MKSIYLLLGAAVVTTITAFTFPAPEQAASFADKYWILESGTVVPAIDLNGDSKPDSDIRVMLEDCEKDDAEMYKTGGTTVKHRGTIKCDEEDETEEESGTWKYNAATKQLTVQHADTRKPQLMTVKELSANKMTCTMEFTSAKGKHLITAVFRLK